MRRGAVGAAYRQIGIAELRPPDNYLGDRAVPRHRSGPIPAASCRLFTSARAAPSPDRPVVEGGSGSGATEQGSLSPRPGKGSHRARPHHRRPGTPGRAVGGGHPRPAGARDRRHTGVKPRNRGLGNSAAIPPHRHWPDRVPGTLPTPDACSRLDGEKAQQSHAAPVRIQSEALFGIGNKLPLSPTSTE